VAASLASALLGAAVLAGCSAEQPPSQGVSGTVRVDGSSTLTPLVRAAVDELVAEVEPGVTVVLTTSGTSAGIERLCAADADVAMASRPMTDDERAACEASGVQAVPVPLGTDAVSVVVPRRNDYVGCLSTDELARIFGAAGTGRRTRPADDVAGRARGVARDRARALLARAGVGDRRRAVRRRPRRRAAARRGGDQRGRRRARPGRRSQPRRARLRPAVVRDLLAGPGAHGGRGRG
jgi:hypothetical protein